MVLTNLNKLNQLINKLGTPLLHQRQVQNDGAQSGFIVQQISQIMSVKSIPQQNTAKDRATDPGLLLLKRVMFIMPVTTQSSKIQVDDILATYTRLDEKHVKVDNEYIVEDIVKVKIGENQYAYEISQFKQDIQLLTNNKVEK